ncbi:hypothetical protein PSFL111601_18650 [Pseudomonas floridensis]
MMANTMTPGALNIAVVIPCCNVRKLINNVIVGIGKEVDRIYVVDDCCPEGSGREAQGNCRDAQVRSAP